MSGSTRVSGGGDWWEITFETPSISFLPPAPGEPSAEQQYHASASRRFHGMIDRAREPLDSYLASVAAEYGLVPLARGARRLGLMAPAPGASGILVGMAAPLAPDSAQRLALKVFRLFSAVQRHRPQHDVGTPFHLLRFPSGAIEDHGGDAPGWNPPAELPEGAAQELVRRCAEIILAAEDEGVVHTDLLPDRVLLDEDGTVAITRFGECARPPRLPGAPDDYYEHAGAPAPDWIGLQRRGLAQIARHWGVSSEEQANPRELTERLTANTELDRWSLDNHGPPVLHNQPRGSRCIEERLRNGARGVLRPCQRCHTPTMVGSVVSSQVEGRVLPVCRRCLDRSLARDRVLGYVLWAVIVAVPLGVALWLVLWLVLR